MIIAMFVISSIILFLSIVGFFIPSSGKPSTVEQRIVGILLTGLPLFVLSLLIMLK